MRLLTKIILVSVAALTVVVGATAGIGLYVIGDLSHQSDVRILRSELNALVENIGELNDDSATALSDPRLRRC